MTLPRLVKGLRPLLTLALGTLLMISAEAFAQSCTIQETSSRFVGKNKGADPYGFTSLASIDRVVKIELKKANKHACNASSYTINANILTVNNAKSAAKKCKAKFTVEGPKLGCVESGTNSEIAQNPLFLTQKTEPNVMFLLDDSGSMHFEVMPDLVSYNLGYIPYIFPRVNGIYSGPDFSNYVVTVDPASGFGVRNRSPQINPLYYDPSITYFPWVKADGSRYPDANVLCAPHSPITSGLLNSVLNCRNLTTTNVNLNGNAWVECNRYLGCSLDYSNRGFWPATYYWYKGAGDSWSVSSFETVYIGPWKPYYIGHGRDQRDDCVYAENAVCTYQEELQNFANWYTYYRSRISAARAGSGLAFAQQGANIRVGFGSLNSPARYVDGKYTSVLRKGVRSFTGADRDAFYNELYTLPIWSGTPLRKAVDAAGQYYMRRDNNGPWANKPGTNDSSEQLECRRNYSVLVSDGFWSGSSAGGGASQNNDGSGGPSHSGPGGESYVYKAVSPFSDSRGDTLADAAMYYWKNDLRSDMDNVVPVTQNNPAFWQHMTTFSVGLGVEGTVDPDAAFGAISSGAAVSWPDPALGGVYKIDDLVHAAVNSRGAYYSAADPAAFAEDLADALQTIANEGKASASAIAANSTDLNTGTVIYQASFDSLSWSGELAAYAINSNGSLGKERWTTRKDSFASVSSRNVFAAVGEQGALTTKAVNFVEAAWSQLSDSQRSALQNGGTEADGKLLLNWLRGDRSEEGKAFRERRGILGDIVNSDPAFIQTSDDFGFKALPGSEGSSYDAYLNAKQSLVPTILVGANDGMLHGFNADTGSALFSFMPLASFPNLAELASADYQHRFFVDGSPRVSDAYLNGGWRTVAVAGMGAGGRSVFALDVSDPQSIDKDSLLWEFATAAGDEHKLGVAMSAPIVVRLAAENRWVAIFGNGYNSGDNVKLFIVDLASGELLKAIDTGVSGIGNGLASPVPTDIDADRITDFVYAGDLQGNLWKFDLRGKSVGKWDVAIKQGVSPRPLFKAVDDAGRPQPITSRPTVGIHQDGGYYVYFGTGKYFENGDVKLGSSPQLQDFYGIRDLDSTVVSRADLQVQDIIFEQRGTTGDGSKSPFSVRVVSNEGNGAAPTYGWRLPLQPPDNSVEGERSVSRPILRNGRIIFTTLIPNDNNCGYGGRSWLMEVDAQTGGRFPSPVLDTNADGLIDELDGVWVNGEFLPISGKGSDEIIKTPGIVGAGEIEYKYTSGSSGNIGITAEKGTGDGETLGRQSWRQLQ